MRKVFPFFLFLALGLVLSSFVLHKEKTETAETAEKNVKWYTWEEAVEANKKKKKKFFVDIYTDWCGWCKRMDKATFEDPAVAAILNRDFYPIKLDAEQKADIIFNGHTFKWVNAGRKGIHELAYSLLDGKMSYPSLVFLDENVDRIMISKGFKSKADFLPELDYIKDGHYSKVSLDKFKQTKP